MNALANTVVAPRVETGVAAQWNLSIGGIQIQISAAPGMKAALRAPADSFKAAGDRPVAIKLTLDWADHLEHLGDLIFDSGALWRLFKNGERWIFDFATPLFGSAPYKRMVCDSAFSAGEILLSTQYFDRNSTVYPLEYPLDEVLVTHRLMHDSGVEIHGCGLVSEDRKGLLFVGHSGAGKSTTARLWGRSKAATVLSDDRIILRARGDGVWMYGTPWHGDEGLASPARSRLDSVFLLEHATVNSMKPLRASQAVSELLARTFVPMHSAQALNEAIKVLEAVVAQAPNFKFGFVPDQSSVQYAAVFDAN